MSQPGPDDRFRPSRERGQTGRGNAVSCDTWLLATLAEITNVLEMTFSHPTTVCSLCGSGYQRFNVVREKSGILDLHSLQIRTRHSLRCDLRRSLTSIPRLVKCCPIMLHDVDADRRTQVRLAMIPVDFGDQVIDRLSVLARDVGERVPHDGFKSDAGSMIANEDSAGYRAPPRLLVALIGRNAEVRLF